MSSDLHGIWTLIEIYGEREDGERAYPFGRDAVGRLTYHPDGRMSAFIARSNREKFIGDVGQPSDAEVRAAFESFEAYCGTYTVDADRGLVVHHVEIARLPDYEGTDLVRHFVLDGDTLVIRSAPFDFGGSPVVVHVAWNRG